MAKRGRPFLKLNTKDSAAWLGVGEDKFRSLVEEGLIAAVEVLESGAKLYLVRDLKAVKKSL